MFLKININIFAKLIVILFISLCSYTQHVTCINMTYRTMNYYLISDDIWPGYYSQWSYGSNKVTPVDMVVVVPLLAVLAFTCMHKIDVHNNFIQA